MNIIRTKYFYQIGHFVAGHPENMERVDESFLRTLEEQAGIQEKDVYSWRSVVYSEYMDGLCQTVDSRMGHILADRGCV